MSVRNAIFSFAIGVAYKPSNLSYKTFLGKDSISYCLHYTDRNHIIFGDDNNINLIELQNSDTIFTILLSILVRTNL